MPGEVTTLEHELWDDTVEARACVTEAVLARSKLTEVPSGLGYDVVEELEDDTASGLVVNRDIELKCPCIVALVFFIVHRSPFTIDEVRIPGEGVNKKA